MSRITINLKKSRDKDGLTQIRLEFPGTFAQRSDKELHTPVVFKNPEDREGHRRGMLVTAPGFSEFVPMGDLSLGVGASEFDSSTRDEWIWAGGEDARADWDRRWGTTPRSGAGV